MQNTLGAYGCVALRNGKHVIAFNEVQDHWDMPYYPKTSQHGILHCIHPSRPLIPLEATAAEVFAVAKREMSKVRTLNTCSAYADISRFNILLDILL